MMHPQVFISGLILLLPGAVDSYVAVKGVVGHPVTLPCTYSTFFGTFNTCWGQGPCPSSRCANTLIWTNGYRITYQRSSRYQLKGNISGGNVSLTIENAVESDSGLYCCRVEVRGWFNDQKVEVKPEILTSPPTRPTTTGRPTTIERPTTTRPTTLSTGPTRVPASPRDSTSAPTTPAHTQTHTPEPTTSYPSQTTAQVTEIASYTPADWNNTVTSSDDSRNNDTRNDKHVLIMKSMFCGCSRHTCSPSSQEGKEEGSEVPGHCQLVKFRTAWDQETLSEQQTNLRCPTAQVGSVMKDQTGAEHTEGKESVSLWKTQKNMSNDVSTGVSTAVLLLLLLVCIAVITKKANETLVGNPMTNAGTDYLKVAPRPTWPFP
ncbi:hepatitis A virus cellular receptor 1 homolog [Arvicola amphibius]|uniref:hepatitis A virus cellular receptor 1 homolog n=1 Tax=Arvicola amphibius TaxID=1047088 RepID=UPI001C08D85D|nr:hepatitis A virus cellular receptor 1 homolog [Arvicola amphibius]